MTKHIGTDEKYYLGIEATGRTVAVLADEEGNLLGRGLATQSSVYSAVGVERCSQALWSAIVVAFEAAGFNTRDMAIAEATLPEVKAICVAMSGVERPKDEAAVKRIVTNFNLTQQVIVTSDARGALLAGTENGFGVSVLGGEGGLAYASAPDGRSARAGGWGYLLGDEGSAHYIGLQAVHGVLQAADGRGPETVLTNLIAQEWKLTPSRPDVLANHVYKLSTGLGTGGNKAQIEDTIENYKRALAVLAPLVERSAAKGDRVAQQILDLVADNLAHSVRAVITRTDMWEQFQVLYRRAGTTSNQSRRSSTSYELSGKAGQRVVESVALPLTLYGSVINSTAGELRRRLCQRLPQCAEPVLVADPAEGALKLAMQTPPKAENDPI